ncbi:hypothetical protein [Mesorhizobium sp. M0909]|uniref:hypothetical protein n=1 Tax=Mesorhizobium sp. M0909 TaxID=2957024 RepID=UPI00333D421A
MRVFQRILPLAVFALQLFAVQSFAQTEQQEFRGKAHHRQPKMPRMSASTFRLAGTK